jgi:hypothetical protein
MIVLAKVKVNLGREEYYSIETTTETKEYLSLVLHYLEATGNEERMELDG